MPENIYLQDRFYVNLQNESIVWMYHNPDATSGDQFVSNTFDIDMLREAIKECPIGPDSGFEPGPVYDYIAENCRQYLSDVGMIAYDADKEMFESEPTSIGMTHSTMEKILLLFDAKQLIDNYCKKEFDGYGVFDDLKKVGIAYTTTEDDKHEIQVYVNLIDYQTEIYYDGKLLATHKAESLEDYVENTLPYLDFDELVSIPDWILEREKSVHEGPQYMRLEAWGDIYETCLNVNSYVYGGGIALNLLSVGEDCLEPFADITVNLPEQKSGPDCSFIDTNNFPQGEKLIRDYKLGEPTGRIGNSGYCTYPEYRFDMEELGKYCINPQRINDILNPKDKERSDER